MAAEVTKTVSEQIASGEISPADLLWKVAEQGEVNVIPEGFIRAEVNLFLDRAVSYYKAYGVHALAKPGQLLPTGLPEGTREKLEIKVTRLIQTEHWRNALQLRGIDYELNDPRKDLALSILTDPMRKGSFESGLKKVGITSGIWDAWLSDPAFALRFSQMTEENFRKHQGAVNLAVQKGAILEGSKQLDFIRTFNELSGRHDPNKKQMLDMQEVMGNLLDVLSEMLTPEQLGEVAKRLQAKISLGGLLNGSTHDSLGLT